MKTNGYSISLYSLNSTRFVTVVNIVLLPKLAKNMLSYTEMYFLSCVSTQTFIEIKHRSRVCSQKVNTVILQALI